MDKDSILFQLMKTRMDGVMEEFIKKDASYQETKQQFSEYSKKLDALHLPRKINLLIDRYASAHIAHGARYGELAYMLGFSDCVELLLGKPPLSDVKEIMAGNE